MLKPKSHCFDFLRKTALLARVRHWRGVAVIAVLSSVAEPARGHGALDLQIAAAGDAIAREPTNAEHYLRRAELHRLHTDWSSAQGDIDKAIELAPDLPQIDLTLARLLLDTKRYDGAEKALNRFIQRVPNHVDGLVTRGRARVASGSPLQAAEDFGRAIANASQPEPEYYIEQARAFAAAGQEHIPAAIAALDAGMMRLGKLVTLGLYAVELECARRNFDAALERLDKLSAPQPRKEAWHERRGDVLDAAGRSAEAKAAYQAGLEAIKTLPPHIQNTAAVQQRQERLELKMKEAESSSAGIR